MSQLNGKFTAINGWNNLLTLLIAAGYTGRSALVQVHLLNQTATNCYVARTNSNAAAPATPRGTPISTDSAFAPGSSFEWNFGRAQAWLEAGQTWIHTASAIDISFDVTGADF